LVGGPRDYGVRPAMDGNHLPERREGEESQTETSPIDQSALEERDNP
jgi:hypothetical protein